MVTKTRPTDHLRGATEANAKLKLNYGRYTSLIKTIINELHENFKF